MAGKSLGTLTIDLIAKVGGFVSGMDKAERSSAKWRKQVESDVKAAGAALATIGVAAATAAISASAAGITLLKSTSEQINETDRWAKSLRMSTQELLAWQFAAEKAGVSGDQMADIFKDIGDKIGDAVLNKSGEAVDALDALGLSAIKLSRITPDKQLLAISEALNKIKTNAEKTTILESLGNDLSKMLPLFDNNSAKLKQFVSLAKDYGVAPDEKSINDLLKVNELFQDLELQAKGLKFEIASGLAKVDLSPIQKGLDDLRQVFTDPAVLEGLAKLVGGVAELVGWMGKLASESANFISHVTEIPDRVKAGGWANYTFQTGLNDRANTLLGDISAITGPQKNNKNDDSDNYKGGPNGKQTADAGAKKLENAFKATEQSYLRQIALIDTTGKKSVEVTEQQKLQFDIADGKLSGLNDTQRQRLELLATEVDRLNGVKKANEENLKVAEYVANLQRENANSAASLNADIIGAGQGDKVRERLRERLDVEREFNEKRADLQQRYQSGDIKSQAEYDRYTAELEKALSQRLEGYEGYYQQIDRLNADWVTGARDGLANWVDDSTNYASLAAGAMQSAMSGISSNIVDMLNDNKASWKDWGVSVLKVIEQVMVNMAIASAVSSIGSLFSFGASSASSTPSGAYNSAAAGIKLNAKGGVYDSADLSKFSNSIVSSPTMFAFAKGAGLMGEAGPEAIMPLTRASDGSLGVRALGAVGGGGTMFNINAPVSITQGDSGDEVNNASTASTARQLEGIVQKTLTDRLRKEISPGGILYRRT